MNEKMTYRHPTTTFLAIVVFVISLPVMAKIYCYIAWILFGTLAITAAACRLFDGAKK